MTLFDFFYQCENVKAEKGQTCNNPLQDPITRSLHLHYIRDSTLSRIFLFLETCFPRKHCSCGALHAAQILLHASRSPLLFWRSQRLRNNNGSECNNWCRSAKTPGRNRRRSVLKINIYGKGLTPRVSMGDGGSK